MDMRVGAGGAGGVMAMRGAFDVDRDEIDLAMLNAALGDDAL
jgi:hypothetical protein